MATITFDTLKFVERLKAAGVPEEQAKAEVEALAEALSETIAVRELATKSDLESVNRISLNGWPVFCWRKQQL